ncbi:MAG: hypothetical protein ACTHLW_21705 [Verrucomicrobiota bacterium]
MPAPHRWARVSNSADEVEGVERGAVTRWGAVHVHALEHLPISCALTSRALPAGPLLAEIQGQHVANMARAMARKLAQSMRRDGRHVSEATELDGAGAGALAVVAWRSGEEREGSERGAAGVCWRAVVAEMSRDIFGESVSLDEFSAEALAGSALPLPGCYESRTDKATRLIFERARARRGDLLARRVESIKAKGGRGKRAETVERVQRAAVQLLHGEAIDKAAELAGFKPGSGTSKASAGDRLAQAVRRLGFRFQFNARQRTSDKAATRPAMGAGLPASIPAAWSVEPSANLPGQDGRGGKRQGVPLPLPVRFANRAVRRIRAERLASAQAARAARMPREDKRNAKRAIWERRTVRRLKAAGVFGYRDGDGVGAWVMAIHERKAARVPRVKL